MSCHYIFTANSRLKQLILQSDLFILIIPESQNILPGFRLLQ